MIQYEEIRERIADLLARKASVSEFARSLNMDSWSMFSDGSEQSAIDLLAAANLLVSELYDDIIDEREFRNELASLLGHVAIEINEVPEHTLRRSAVSAAWFRLNDAAVDVALAHMRGIGNTASVRPVPVGLVV